MSSSTVQVKFFPSAAELAQAAAEAWLAELQAAQESQTPYSVALSGGRIARILQARAQTVIFTDISLPH
jgi:6-phosphogluconolactonase/glucosamine-6-phosphate isomerase/deaminase